VEVDSEDPTLWQERALTNTAEKRTALPKHCGLSLFLLCLLRSPRLFYFYYNFPRGSGQPRMAVCRDELLTGWTGGTGSKALASVSSQEYPPTFPPVRE
jgi:hypothetical protein